MAKTQLDPLYIPTNVLPATREREMLSFDWLEFAVNFRFWCVYE